MRIALIGTVPPPIGGTSIHLLRLFERLKTENYDVTLFDAYGKSQLENEGIVHINNYKKWIIKYFFLMKEDIIHSHTHSWIDRAILTIGAKLKHKKIIFTFHSLREEYRDLSRFEKWCVKKTLKKADVLICTAQYIKDKLLSWGCSEKKIRVIGPYINPSEIEKNQPCLDAVKDFRENHDFVIVANASNNNIYLEKDLYGIDMCIELLSFLKEKEINVGFIFSITSITDEQRYSSYKKTIEEKKLEKDFMFVNENVSFIPFLMNADVFVRPTNTDTWGISISESIYLGVPAVASDVCQREKGTILFATRNQDDFNEKVYSCIQNIEKEKTIIKGVVVEEHFIEIKNIYTELQVRK